MIGALEIAGVELRDNCACCKELIDCPGDVTDGIPELLEVGGIDVEE